jgi:hypothetical protein
MTRTTATSTSSHDLTGDARRPIDVRAPAQADRAAWGGNSRGTALGAALAS